MIQKARGWQAGKSLSDIAEITVLGEEELASVL